MCVCVLWLPQVDDLPEPNPIRQSLSERNAAIPSTSPDPTPLSYRPISTGFERGTVLTHGQSARDVPSITTATHQHHHGMDAYPFPHAHSMSDFVKVSKSATVPGMNVRGPVVDNVSATLTEYNSEEAQKGGRVKPLAVRIPPDSPPTFAGKFLSGQSSEPIVGSLPSSVIGRERLQKGLNTTGTAFDRRPSHASPFLHKILSPPRRAVMSGLMPMESPLTTYSGFSIAKDGSVYMSSPTKLQAGNTTPPPQTHLALITSPVVGSPSSNNAMLSPQQTNVVGVNKLAAGGDAHGANVKLLPEELEDKADMWVKRLPLLLFQLTCACLLLCSYRLEYGNVLMMWGRRYTRVEVLKQCLPREHHHEDGMGHHEGKHGDGEGDVLKETHPIPITASESTSSVGKKRDVKEPLLPRQKQPSGGVLSQKSSSTGTLTSRSPLMMSQSPRMVPDGGLTVLVSAC